MIALILACGTILFVMWSALRQAAQADEAAEQVWREIREVRGEGED